MEKLDKRKIVYNKVYVCVHNRIFKNIILQIDNALPNKIKYQIIDQIDEQISLQIRENVGIQGANLLALEMHLKMRIRE